MLDVDFRSPRTYSGDDARLAADGEDLFVIRIPFGLGIVAQVLEAVGLVVAVVVARGESLE